jgi:hypothetical protein
MYSPRFSALSSSGKNAVKLVVIAFLLTGLDCSLSCSYNEQESCPEGSFYNFTTSACQECSVCKSPLVETEPCGKYICEYGYSTDTVCCHEYEYSFYGECILDCSKCHKGTFCRPGETKCNCPEDRFGVLCQYSLKEELNKTIATDKADNSTGKTTDLPKEKTTVLPKN